jgi:hypothetical protein
VAAASVVAVYTSVQGDGGNNGLAVTTDGAPADDDHLVVAMCVNANADTLTPPGGWAELTVSDNSIAVSGGLIRAWLLLDPAGATTYAWTAATSTRRSIIGALVRGADPAAFIDVKDSRQSGPGTNHTPPTLASTVADTLVLDFFGLRQFAPDVANWDVPVGLSATEHADVQGGDSNNNIRLACGSFVQAAAGSVSTTPWTNSDTFEDSIGIRLVIRPVAGGAGALATPSPLVAPTAAVVRASTW